MASPMKTEIGELLHRINEGATNISTPLGDVMSLCLCLSSLLGNTEPTGNEPSVAPGVDPH